MLFRKLKKAVLKKRKREEERRPDNEEEEGHETVPFPSGAGPGEEDETSQPPPPKKSKKRRCAACRKKLTLAEGVECECGLLLCGLHRYTDKHECAHDFKSADRAILEKNNQRCVDDKLENRI